MSIEEEFKEYKRSSERKHLNRARVTNLVLGTMSIIVILFMIYGFTQSIEALRQRDLREIVEMKNQLLQQELSKCQEAKKN